MHGELGFLSVQLYKSSMLADSSLGDRPAVVYIALYVLLSFRALLEMCTQST